MSPLEAFLRHHRVLTKFKKNLKGRDNRSFEGWCNMPHPDVTISLAFRWSSTDEGHRFWKTLHRKAGGRFLSDLTKQEFEAYYDFL